MPWVCRHGPLSCSLVCDGWGEGEAEQRKGCEEEDEKKGRNRWNGGKGISMVVRHFLCPQAFPWHLATRQTARDRLLLCDGGAACRGPGWQRCGNNGGFKLDSLQGMTGWGGESQVQAREKQHNH